MKINVLGSSSAGNCTYVEINNIKFLIDVGFSYKYIVEKLNDINVDVKDLNFVIITHSHSDHVMSLYTFYRAHIPIYIGAGAYKELSIKDKLVNVNFVDEIDNILGIKLVKIPISHDAIGFGYVFEHEDNSLVYIADTGVIYSKYFEKLTNKKAYLIESNHDVEMEMSGSKDQRTKIRNIGDEGHISNEDCANKYLTRFIGEETKLIVLIHISSHDNTYDLAYNTTKKIVNDNIKHIVAKEKEETKLIEV